MYYISMYYIYIYICTICIYVYGCVRRCVFFFCGGGGAGLPLDNGLRTSTSCKSGQTSRWSSFCPRFSQLGLRLGSALLIWEFPKIRGTLLGVMI